MDDLNNYESFFEQLDKDRKVRSDFLEWFKKNPLKDHKPLENKVRGEIRINKEHLKGVVDKEVWD